MSRELAKMLTLSFVSAGVCSAVSTAQYLPCAPERLGLVGTQHGGHCAFVVEDQEENDKGWLATELARFGEHVANSHPQEDGLASSS